MNKKEVLYFKEKLEKERANLIEELGSLGKQNPQNPADWQATVDDGDVDPADENEVADKIEEFEEHSAILKQLETQLGEVNSALSKIDKNTYGVCEISGNEIEHDRLEANPAARTCKAHMNDK